MNDQQFFSEITEDINVSTSKKNVSSRKRNIKYFIGIDVSKNKLDFAILLNNQILMQNVVKNDCLSITTYLARLKDKLKLRTSGTIFCMERTNVYGNHLINTLWKKKYLFSVEDARHIKNSMGLVRGKDDRVDAVRIAKFAYRNQEDLKFWKPERLVMTQLKSQIAMRNRLLGLKVALKLPLTDPVGYIHKTIHKDSVAFCKKSLEALEHDFSEVEAKIRMTIRNDERFNHLSQILTSIPSIGPVMATEFIVCTNEFKDITEPKKFACYAGVAPFRTESGVFVSKPKVSHQANKKVKALLHMCAIGCLRTDAELTAYFNRKKKEGKPGMSIVNAIRNKLILRVFACIRQDRCFVNKHVAQRVDSNIRPDELKFSD